MNPQVQALAALVVGVGGGYFFGQSDTKAWQQKYASYEKSNHSNKVAAENATLDVQKLNTKLSEAKSKYADLKKQFENVNRTWTNANNLYQGKMFPEFTGKHRSLMSKHLTPEMYDRLSKLRTKTGVTFNDCIRTGVLTPHLGVGMTAGDEESYEVWAELFNPIIKGWHKGYDAATMTHTSNLNPDELVFPADVQA